MHVKIAFTLALLGLMSANLKAHVGAPPSGMQFLNECEGVLLNDQMVLDIHMPNAAIEKMKHDMNHHVMGQTPGIQVIADTWETVQAQLNNPIRPLGRFMFVGPTGVGKTEATKALVRYLGGDPDVHLIRIDCGEFQEKHKISQLIGTSAGYAGYGDSPRFHPSNLEKTRLKATLSSGKKLDLNVVLVDELEKCHPDIFDLLLGVLDNGAVTLGDNTRVNLRNSLIISTSNLGAQGVEMLIEKKREQLRARPGTDPFTMEEADLTGRYDQNLRGEISEAYRTAIKGKYKPEFINRWDVIVDFYHLSDVEFLQILQKQLALIQTRIFEQAETKIGLMASETARRFVVSQGTDFKNGARELDRTSERLITKPVARLLQTGQVREGDVVLVDLKADGSRLTYQVIARGLTRGQLLDFADREYPGYKMMETDFEKLNKLHAQAADAKAKEGANPKPTANVFEHIANNAEVVKRLYLNAKGPKADLNVKMADGALVQAACKYVKIGDRYVRLENLSVGTMRASIASSIPSSIQQVFPEDKLDRWSEDEVREMIKDIIAPK